MRNSAMITGIAAAFFALSGMAQSPEETSGFLFKPERRLLLEKFNNLTNPTLDDRLLALNQILATYPSAQAGGENLHSLLQSPDLNEVIRAQFCLVVAKFNDNPGIMTHDGLGKLGAEDLPAATVQLKLANTLFDTANRVCGYREKLTPFALSIEQEDDTEQEAPAPSKSTPLAPPQKKRPAPKNDGVVMLA